MFAIACDRGARRKICGTPGCGRECEALCDYPVKRKGKDATCDAKLCDRCRVRQPQDRDFCPAHERFANSRASAPPGIPDRGQARVHVSSATKLYVHETHRIGGWQYVTYAAFPPTVATKNKSLPGMYTVKLEVWNEKTRPVG